jgi:hypothetical protein
MSSCPECGRERTLYSCPECGDGHCVDHRLPEEHDCPAVVSERETESETKEPTPGATASTEREGETADGESGPLSKLMIQEVREHGLSVTEWARWWWLIPFRYLGFGAVLLGFLLGGLAGSVLNSEIIGAVFILGIAGPGFVMLLLSLLAPYAVYVERKRLRKNAEWYPSGWYYLILFPGGLLALLLSFVYATRRLKYHGMDAYPWTGGSETTNTQHQIPASGQEHISED